MLPALFTWPTWRGNLGSVFDLKWRDAKRLFHALPAPLNGSVGV